MVAGAGAVIFNIEVAHSRAIRQKKPGTLIRWNCCVTLTAFLDFYMNNRDTLLLLAAFADESNPDIYRKVLSIHLK